MSRLLSWLARWWLARVERLELERRRRRALPDGTRVCLTCKCRGYGAHAHEGIWTTEYKADSDDYRLTRQSDGETTYATRKAIAVTATR